MCVILFCFIEFFLPFFNFKFFNYLYTIIIDRNIVFLFHRLQSFDRFAADLQTRPTYLRYSVLFLFHRKNLVMITRPLSVPVEG